MGSLVDSHMTSFSTTFVSAAGHRMFYAPKSLPPLDFSYCDLTQVTDAINHHLKPRGGRRNLQESSTQVANSPKASPVPANRSDTAKDDESVTSDSRNAVKDFFDDSDLDEDETTTPAGNPIAHAQYSAHSLKLCNNRLTNLYGMNSFFSVVVEGATLTTIDLSSNLITTLPGVREWALVLPSLRILYLHNNYISSLSEVMKLKGIPSLESLSLHQNPLQRRLLTRHRPTLLLMLPNLKILDFVKVTASEFPVVPSVLFTPKILKEVADAEAALGPPIKRKGGRSNIVFG